MDKLRPATLLLAVLAGWAVLLLVMALLGLGGRYAIAADNAQLAPAMPQFTLTKINSRLGALADYQEVSNRPLMMPERRPVAISAPDADTAGFDVQLTSVLITPTLQMAIVTDNQGGATRRVRMGETVQGTSWRLVQLEPRRAVFEGPAGQRSLDLRVFNGGGAPPATPLAETPPDVEAAPAPPATTPSASIRPPVASVDAAQPTDGQPKIEPPPQTQEQQIEAIRKRIEARRAQARAEQAQEKSGQK